MFRQTSAFRPDQPAFTLVEVLVTMSISTVLFLAISSLMVTFFRLNSDIQRDIETNQEKEIVYLTLRNYLEEAEKIEFQDTVTDPAKHKIILRNDLDSSILPYTAIQVDSATPNNLAVTNFALANTVGNPVIAAAPTKTVAGYSIEYANNRVVKGTPPASPGYCLTAASNNCILAGFKPHELTYGFTGFAPFVSITKPTDMIMRTAAQCDGTVASANYLCVLAPYEEREYQINLSDLKITLTGRTATLDFPYYYNTGNSPQSVQIGAWPSLSAIVPLKNNYRVTGLKLTKDVYPVPGSPYELDQLVYTLENPNSNSSPKSTSFLFKLFEK